MQTLNCTVRLGGKIMHTVRKKSVTVAELAVLRAVHGADAIVELEAGAVLAEAYPPTREKERLALIYGGQVVLGLFPGMQEVPESFEEIGLAMEGGRLIAPGMEAMNEGEAAATLMTSGAAGVVVTGAPPINEADEAEDETKRAE
jgi:hypothetical protein